MTIRPTIPKTGIEMLHARVAAAEVRVEGAAERRDRDNRPIQPPTKQVLPDLKAEPRRPSAESRAVPDARRQAELDRLKKATQQFEAVFVKDLLSRMRKGVAAPKNEGPMGELARDMMDQAIADEFSRTGALGIGKMLYERLADAYLKQEAAKEAVSEER